MQHAMMRAAESVIFKKAVGVADEIAIGEEEQLHEVERFGVVVCAAGGPSGSLRGSRRPDRGLWLQKLAQLAFPELLSGFEAPISQLY
jgi:hypothetical protein